MKLLWLDLNSSYAHSSLALPALHAQIADDNAIEWDIVSATINENVGMVAGEIYRRRPDLLAAWKPRTTTDRPNNSSCCFIPSRAE